MSKFAQCKVCNQVYRTVLSKLTTCLTCDGPYSFTYFTPKDRHVLRWKDGIDYMTIKKETKSKKVEDKNLPHVFGVEYTFTHKDIMDEPGDSSGLSFVENFYSVEAKLEAEMRASSISRLNQVNFNLGVKASLKPKDPTNDIYSKLKLIKKKYKHAYVDSNRIEIVSTPSKNLTEHLTWYKGMLEYMASLGFYPKLDLIEKEDDIQDIGTGGGHIHIDIPTQSDLDMGVRAAFSTKLISFMAANPYVAWVFNEWSDDENAKRLGRFELQQLNSLIQNKLNMNTSWLIENKDRLTLDYIVAEQCELVDSKWRCISFRTLSSIRYIMRSEAKLRCSKNRPNPIKTVEYRFFDAPKTVEIAGEHLGFASNFTTFVSELSASEMSTWFVDHKGDKIADDKKALYKHYCKRFEQLVVTLGLDPKVYNKYLSNMKDRFEFGELK